MKKQSSTYPVIAPAGFLRRLFDLPYLLLPLTMLFWSGNFIVGRAVNTAVPPIGLAFWRWGVGSILIFGFAWPHLKRDWPAVRRSWGIILLFAILGVTIFNTLVYTGLQYTQAINALLMQSAMPVIIVVMTYLFFRETITLVQALGVGISLACALTIIARGDLQVLVSLSLNAGDALVFTAVVCYAGYSALLRLRPAIHPLSFLAVTFIPGTLILLPFYLWETLSGRPMVFDPVTLLAVAYVAIFPSILAYLFFNRGVELVGANRAGLFLHLMPVFGSLMAIVFLGESFRLFHTIGIVLILSGIVLATQFRRPL